MNLLFVSGIAEAQVITNYTKLKQISAKSQESYKKKKDFAVKFLKQKKQPVKVFTDSVVYEVQYIDKNGVPQYLITNNANAAKTISTDKVYDGGGAGFYLDGSGVTVREWDAGNVRSTHQELTGRIVNADGNSIAGHSTHVAGTIIATGIEPAAKGMASSASLKSFNWDYSDSEMASEASKGCLLSNHSYGWLRGWNGTKWWGDTTVSKLEDYKFGFYDETSRIWDEIAYNAPYYLIVKSSGNDRGQSGDGTYPPDGPYDCIEQYGISKNILTVGAVYDIVSGYSQPLDVVMTSFSSWGPADDGRIKPDIVANGTSLYSSYSTSDSAYTNMTGTSMSTPSVTGSLALLVQHYADVYGDGEKMRASTLKALVINTAGEAGDYDGPDYSFGWGLMNTEKAALKISQSDTADVILERVLEENQTYEKYFTLQSNSSIRVTLVWTDPPGKIPAQFIVDPDDPALINNLDLKVVDTTANITYYPWTLDKDNPSDFATKAVNNVDNVEQVDINEGDSSHVYKISVTHTGNLVNDRQAFSLVISADFETSGKPFPDFYTSEVSPAENQSVFLFDASENKPDTWKWSFLPSTVEFVNGTDSTSKNPVVKFLNSGSYSVSLNVSNSGGDSAITKVDYINVGGTPEGYCDAYSLNGWGHISNVKFCSIDNSSSETNVGDQYPNQKYYENWTPVSTEIVRGQRRLLEITNSVTDVAYTLYLDVFVWIDWNRDGDFFDEGELVVEDIDNGGGGDFLITVPFDADLGKTRMRIRTHYYNDYSTNPCGYTEYGEVEDYMVDIVDPEPITWTGAVNSNWDEPGNWSTGEVPDFKSDVLIPSNNSGGTSPALSDTTVEINSLEIESNASLNVDGEILIYGSK